MLNFITSDKGLGVHAPTAENETTDTGLCSGDSSDLVAGEDAHAASVQDVPQSDGAVRGTGGHVVGVGVEAGASHVGEVTGKYPQWLVVICCPQTERASAMLDNHAHGQCFFFFSELKHEREKKFLTGQLCHVPRRQNSTRGGKSGCPTLGSCDLCSPPDK